MCPACSASFAGNAELTQCPDDRATLLLVSADPFLGTLVSKRYRVLTLIGLGGWSVVYKAKDVTLNRLVALKILHAHLSPWSDKVKRFQREAEAASALNHPNVMTVFDCGVLSQGQPYLVMEYMEGLALSDIIRKEGQVSVKRCLPIFQQACDALAAAHDNGVIHRDLKPGNLLIVKSDQGEDLVKVLDFGLAKFVSQREEGFEDLTGTGETLGTPHYMSPEQCTGRQLDCRSDIYSLGCVMYEALSGKKPLPSESTFECMTKQLVETPLPLAQIRPDLHIPEALEAVVFKALSKDPCQRYQTMDSMKQALSGALAGGPAGAKATSKPGASKRALARGFLWLLILSAVAGGAAALLKI